MYSIVYLPENALCEAYPSGDQYELYTTKRAAERGAASLVERYPGCYAVVPVPSIFAGFSCDPEYAHPHYLENPDLTEAEIDAYYAGRDTGDLGAHSANDLPDDDGE